MDKKYRVYKSRWDVPETVCDTFTSASDECAIEKFRKIKERADHEWDDLRLERVDVEEVVTYIPFL